jgi:hypothetical protein
VNLANGTALNAATISGATSATLTLTSITSPTPAATTSS